ncbi:MAG: alpha/beta hydrolase, partial [Paracoccaceae bacterium]|nr:alpha/beta hydrolase [Paracoccaceae bacterium]
MKHFKTFDGLNIAYQDEGEGLPVLCLSGLTRNSSDFDYVAPHLKGVRLIRTDYRGRGASDWDVKYKNYTIPVEARDVICLLDHLGIDRAAMLATSRGGLIAMALAATAKDRMIGVCLNDIGPVIDPSGLDRIMDYVGHRPRFATQEDMARAMAK